jgi:LysM repeat protein
MQMNRSISHLVRWTLIGALMLSLLAAALPQPAQAQDSSLCEETHVVQGGETIYKIARRYEKSVNRLAVTNNLERPYRLTVGQRLCIPGKATGAALAAWTPTFSDGEVTLIGASFKKDYPFIVRVREDDTSSWHKLGQVKTNRNGELRESLDVPDDLVRVPAINVCLKDAFTDVLTCKRVFRQ